MVVQQVVYIGARFNIASHGRMATLYLDKGKRGLERYGNNLLQMDLENGYSVIIRQATPAELGLLESKLKDIRAGIKRAKGGSCAL